MSIEDEKPRSTKYKRTLRVMKENAAKNMILVFILVTCIAVLIINNIKTYSTCGILSYQLQEMQKKQISTKKIEAKPLVNVLDSEIQQKTAEKLNKLIDENNHLKEVNKKIEEDNISLQNSLKLAAMVGVKPKNYSRPPVITSRSMTERWKHLGKFKGTAYTPSASECGNNKGITYSGKPIIPGTTIAVDTKYWPIGTVFYIKGIGYVTAMDTGNAVKGKNRFDFAVFDRKFAYALGTRYWDVYLVKLGKGRI